MRRILAVIIAALLAIGIAVAVAPDALATMTGTCYDDVKPVAISAARVNSTTIRIAVFSPLNSTAHVYAEDNGSNPHVEIHEMHITQGSTVTFLQPSGLEHRLWAADVADVAYAWHTPTNQLIGSCHSPLFISY